MSETQEQTALAVVETLVPAKLFAPGNIEEVLIKIEEQVRKEAAELDPGIKKEADKLVSLAGKVSSSKVAMDNAGKSLIESEQKKIDAINAERKMVRDRMDKLRDDTKKPVTDERNRVAEHERELASLVYHPQWGDTASLEEIEGRLVYLKRHPERDWQEFAKKADKAVAEEISKANNWLIAAQAAAAAAAERARHEAEEAERQRIAAVEAQKAREAEIAHQAAETARIEAEQHAAKVAAHIEAERKAEAERLEAARAADLKRLEDERQAQADAAQAEIDRTQAEVNAAETARLEAIDAAKRTAQKREYALSLIGHVKSCGLGFIGDQPQPYGLLFYELENKVKFTGEEFGELLPEAIAAKDEALKRLRDGQEAQRKRHEEDQAAERAKAEADAKAESKAHRAAINNKIVAALSAIVPEAVAKEIIKAIVLGTVPNVKVLY